jgi:hypothetical protein
MSATSVRSGSQRSGSGGGSVAVSAGPPPGPIMFRGGTPSIGSIAGFGVGQMGAQMGGGGGYGMGGDFGMMKTRKSAE